MKSIRILMALMWVVILATGCSQEPEMTAPDMPTVVSIDKDGTEILGPPSIDIASGTCFAQGGVGMVGKDVGVLDINVPAGDINQVLLYWSGGTTGADGDSMIKIDGNDVTGTLIGGPTLFFQNNGVDYFFTAYRADITNMALVANGDNSFEITDFDFDFSGGTLDENHGIGMMVIYDDGTPAEIQIVDGLDVAFFGFNGDLQVTEPQTLTFLAEEMDRTAKMVIFSGSVGEGRPNEIHLTTSAGTDIRVDELNSADDDLWDTLCLEDVFIPAGDTSITVELVSTPSQDPLGASLTWIGCGLSVPVTPPDYCIGDYVWYDTNRNGCQDPDEMPAEGVEVSLYAGCPDGTMMGTTVTNSEGYYEFCELMPGDYTVQFMAPDGYYFCEQNAPGCDPENDSNAGEDGMTDCITIVDADDWSIDAALCQETFCIGDLVWYDANRDGCQGENEMPAEGVEVILYEGCEDGEVVASTFTSSTGYYAFCDLLPGDYTVQFVAPEGYYFCAQYSGDCDTDNDSNAGEDGMTDCVTIVDASNWSIDAALCVPTACLGDYVWEDLNMDGIQDDGEPGRMGVSVNLYDCEGNMLGSTLTDADGYYMFCDLEPGQYLVEFMLPGGYAFSPQDQGGDNELDSDADPVTGMTVCIDLGPGDNDLTWDAGIYEIIEEEIGCRMTGGGNDEFFLAEGGVNEYTFGGQAGAPLASEPQPWGNWTHTQKRGESGSFTFHGGTPSAPEGTEIDWIECSDPGWCEQARPAPAKQLDFGGVGTFKNMRGVPEEIAQHVIVRESLHWFEVNIDDMGEPGSHNEPEGCDPLGFGRNGGTELGDCDCPDFYRIRIYEGMDDSSNIMYEVYGYIDGGNFQIHPPTGRDRINWE